MGEATLLKHFPERNPGWRGTSGGSTRQWRSQRARVLLRDGQRCTHIDDNGQRCTTATPDRLEVHHLRPGLGLAAPDHELATVCTKHNPRGAA